MTAVLDTFTKDPNEVLDYALDWDATNPGPYLESGETVSTATWTVPSGITKDSQAETTTVTTITLSGGTVNTDYVLTVLMVTTSGREVERSFRVLVRDR